MAIYRNKTDQPLAIPLIGVVLPGATIETQVEINNQNLEKVEVSQNKQEEAKKANTEEDKKA